MSDTELTQAEVDTLGDHSAQLATALDELEKNNESLANALDNNQNQIDDLKLIKSTLDNRILASGKAPTERPIQQELPLEEVGANIIEGDFTGDCDHSKG